MEKRHRELAARQEGVASGRVTFGDALAIYREQTEASLSLKPLAKTYRLEVVKATERTWPGVRSLDVQRISESDCKEWAQRFGQEYSATRYNAAPGDVFEHLRKHHRTHGRIFVMDNNPIRKITSTPTLTATRSS